MRHAGHCPPHASSGQPHDGNVERSVHGSFFFKGAMQLLLNLLPYQFSLLGLPRALSGLSKYLQFSFSSTVISQRFVENFRLGGILLGHGQG
jgi:hypothetical protein